MAGPGSSEPQAPSTRILSVAGTGGHGQPARITFTLDLDNLRSQAVGWGRAAAAAAARLMALSRVAMVRGVRALRRHGPPAQAAARAAVRRLWRR
ncbi:hypothetical protein ACJEM9_24175, partial [Escherichia coli]